MTPSLFIVDDEAPARMRLKTLLADIAGEFPHRVVGEAETARAALAGIVQASPDIVLLDIQMPGKSGMALASEMSMQMAQPPVVIFVTAYDEHAVEAFEVRAADYLLKPVRAERLLQAVRRAGVLCQRSESVAEAIPDEADAARRREQRSHFTVQDRGRLLLVPATEVIFLKAELKYVTLQTAQRQYLIEESLTSIEERFPTLFVRAHRSILVARDAIAGVERGIVVRDCDPDGDLANEAWHILLRGSSERLPISRRQWPVIKALVK
ncbi:two component transcriptional regulator, LytTR family [Noviherbaspirillum humi]|uniref:Two component transcriptional regulator, LytTR family n=1 Tax=Noviherbaspirillum humi TaxID=1688639 RepID=A0A239GTI9_9BURK|nr:LytTR family DNA-binding domain-containing protein [Noviherbaspirillum humi]SNS72291.1 two component transcriptional regulator, LytTR family [Noviherbaspirillum humi]